jgi:uncharacterized protein (TIGR03032 family)
MAMCTRRAIWIFRATGTLRDLEGNAQPYDLCYAPRQTHITGDVSAHEVALVGRELLFINTRFSAICSLHPDWSFVPRWMPPFVSVCVPEDRCHLNGMAVDPAGIRFVTALGRSDVAQGWRPGKVEGGVLLSYPDGEVVSEGFAMPHSPRLYANNLFVLDSGRGELTVVDQANGTRRTVARLPGYLRGLAFHDRYAFVGMCKMREHREFGGVPIEALKDQLKCGIHIIDITRGQSIGLIEFTRGVEELFDIQVVGARNLHILGMEEETIDGVFIVPPAPASAPAG